MTAPTLAEKVATVLGLPPNADNATVLAEVERLSAAVAEREVSAAITTGAISAAHRDIWLNSFAADHEGTRAALASMAPQAALIRSTYAPPAVVQSRVPADPAVASLAGTSGLSDVEANDCLWRLGVRAGLTPPVRTIGYLLTNDDGTPFQSKNKM
jgi:hypothetical protein